MLLHRTILAALSLIAISVSSLPSADALVGRIGSHSIGAVRRLQQSSSRRGKTRHATAHRLHRTLRTASRRHQHGKARHLAGHLRHGKRVAHHNSSPSYLWSAPDLDNILLTDEVFDKVNQQFANGIAETYSTPALIQADVFVHCPLHGGIFRRRSAVKNIILHSTETAREANAQRVIASWNNKGLRHAGAQFVVDRDGTIYCTADPIYGTTHVDNRKTRNGVNNDNSIGIEIVRTGVQEYSAEQLDSVVCLVKYLQDRFHVDDNRVLGHGQVQPSDRSDPVNFNWQAFASDKQLLNRTAFASKTDSPDTTFP